MAAVTRVASFSGEDDDDARWEIIVSRGPHYRSPDVNDVPLDIRRELRSWLDSAKDGS